MGSLPTPTTRSAPHRLAGLTGRPAERFAALGPSETIPEHPERATERELLDRIEALAPLAEGAGCAFQATTVTVASLLRTVAERQQQAASTSISLAQRERLLDMVRATREACAHVSSLLNRQGHQMMQMSAAVPSPRLEKSWWFALTGTIHTLDDGVQRLSSLVAGQPKGAPSRRLVSLVARLMRTHHQALLSEAETWLDG